MANDQYEQREENYMNSIGGKVAGVVTPLARTHLELQRTYAQDVAKTLTETVPIKVSVDRAGKRYELVIHIPLLLVTAVRPLDYDAGTGVKTRMTVTASQSSKTEVGSKVETGAQAGWGPVSASFKAEVTVGHEQQRKSDYSSTIDVEVKLVSREPPEMVSKLSDMIGEFVRGNIQLMLQEIDAGNVEPVGDSPAAPELAAE